MKIITVSAGIFCLTCWVLAVLELQGIPDLSVQVANSPEKSDSYQALEPASVFENTSFVEFTKQPLFRPDRQPIDWALINRSNEDDAQKSLTHIEKRYQLKGISISEPKKSALIFDTERSQTLMLSLDENLSGWSLKLVDKGSVTFTRQARKLQLFLSQPDTSQQNIIASKTLPVKQKKPLKLISSVPDDDPYQ